MRKAKAALAWVLVVTACGFSTGCDTKILEELVWESLVTGVKAEIQEIPGMIADEVWDRLGLGGEDDNGES